MRNLHTLCVSGEGEGGCVPAAGTLRELAARFTRLF
jgi:hypothetical protein